MNRAKFPRFTDYKVSTRFLLPTKTTDTLIGRKSENLARKEQNIPKNKQTEILEKGKGRSITCNNLTNLYNKSFRFVSVDVSGLLKPDTNDYLNLVTEVLQVAQHHEISPEENFATSIIVLEECALFWIEKENGETDGNSGSVYWSLEDKVFNRYLERDGGTYIQNIHLIKNNKAPAEWMINLDGPFKEVCRFAVHLAKEFHHYLGKKYDGLKYFQPYFYELKQVEKDNVAFVKFNDIQQTLIQLGTSIPNHADDYSHSEAAGSSEPSPVKEQSAVETEINTDVTSSNVQVTNSILNSNDENNLNGSKEDERDGEVLQPDAEILPQIQHDAAAATPYHYVSSKPSTHSSQTCGGGGSDQLSICIHEQEKRIFTRIKEKLSKSNVEISEDDLRSKLYAIIRKSTSKLNRSLTIEQLRDIDKLVLSLI